MGGFYLVRGAADESRDRRIRGIEKAFAEQGFAAPRRYAGAFWSLGLYADFHGRESAVVASGSEFRAAAVGTLRYAGAFGELGLSRLVDDFDGRLPDARKLGGAFTCIIRRGDRLWLMGDPIGLYRLYVTARDTVVTSSFLAAVAAADSREVCDQGIYEYIFQEATFGCDTVLRDVRALPAFVLHEITPRAIETGGRYPLPPAAFERRSPREHADGLLERIREIFGAVAGAFGSEVSTALSGGFDSRLALAALLDQGLAPEVHVYGRSTDVDVRVAKAVAAGEGFELEHVDKSKWVGNDADAYRQVVRRNYLHFDGLPSDGVLDWGGDLETRVRRSAGGQLHVNGGGGEVMRNFFYLPKRDLSVRQFLWSFYSRFDPAACTKRFDQHAYLEALGTKVKETLGISGELIQRPDLELLYPFFRCRYWTGRNNSVNSRFGRETTPFLDYALVERAVRLPLDLKNYGRIEADLINRLSPRLASYPTAYGYSFDRSPPLAYRLKVAASYYRPPSLRRYSFRVQNRRGAARRGNVLAPDLLRAIVNPELPRVSRWFDVRRIGDDGQRRRLVTLEYFLETIDAVM